jgi:ketosteroid isomerase-like protein
MVSSPLDAYYAAVDAGDADEATATFTDDGLYIRPSLNVPGTLEIVRGHDELAEFFRNRGNPPFRHEVVACAVDGTRCFVEGVAYVEERPTTSFLVHATVDDDGLIRRYFALMGDLAPAPR